MYGAVVSNVLASRCTNAALSTTTPISVFSSAECWSKLNEPTKIRSPSIAKVFAYSDDDDSEPNLRAVSRDSRAADCRGSASGLRVRRAALGYVG